MNLVVRASLDAIRFETTRERERKRERRNEDLDDQPELAFSSPV